MTSARFQTYSIVEGLYQVKVELFSYDNPTGRCQECPLLMGQHSSCDDQNRNNRCYDSDDIRPCDIFFIFCLRPLNNTGRDCSYVARVTSDTDWQGRDLPIDQVYSGPNTAI